MLTTSSNTFIDTFRGKRILVTGHSGFKGSWLAFALNEFGAEVYGLSDCEPADLRHSYHALKVNEILMNKDNQWGDIRDFSRVRAAFQGADFDFVFHLAAQALVSTSFEKPLDTFATNALGTVNLLEAMRRVKYTGIAVLITSDKAYKNDDTGKVFVESDELGGFDPYSASKGMAELAIRSYLASYPMHLGDGKFAVTRAGNVFGGGDWSENRLIPDIMRNVLAGSNILLRKPDATRPWTHVLDILKGYLEVAIALKIETVDTAQAWNFASGETKTVLEIAKRISETFQGNVQIQRALSDDVEEPKLLQISAEKAINKLAWSVTMTVDEWLDNTLNWYLVQQESGDVLEISRADVRKVFNY